MFWRSCAPTAISSPSFGGLEYSWANLREKGGAAAEEEEEEEKKRVQCKSKGRDRKEVQAFVHMAMP